MTSESGECSQGATGAQSSSECPGLGKGERSRQAGTMSSNFSSSYFTLYCKSSSSRRLFHSVLKQSP